MLVPSRTISEKHGEGWKMPVIKRLASERRSGRDRRRFISMQRFSYNGPERRDAKDRRSRVERRDGWVRVSKWSSVEIQGLKIARFIR
jgi:hypothetical protein